MCKWTRNAWKSLIAVSENRAMHARRTCALFHSAPMHLPSERFRLTQTGIMCDAHFVTYTKPNTCSLLSHKIRVCDFCCCRCCCGVCEKMRNFHILASQFTFFLFFIFFKSWIRKRAGSREISRSRPIIKSIYRWTSIWYRCGRFEGQPNVLFFDFCFPRSCFFFFICCWRWYWWSYVQNHSSCCLPFLFSFFLISFCALSSPANRNICIKSP